MEKIIGVQTVAKEKEINYSKYLLQEKCNKECYDDFYENDNNIF